MALAEHLPPSQFFAAERMIRARRSGLLFGDSGAHTIYGPLREMTDPGLRIVNMNFGTGIRNFTSLVGVPFDGHKFHFEEWGAEKPYVIYRHLDVYLGTHDRNEEFKTVNRGLHESLMHAGGVLITLQSNDPISFEELSGNEYYASSFSTDFAHLLLSQTQLSTFER
jgi:hypothetical protein